MNIKNEYQKWISKKVVNKQKKKERKISWENGTYSMNLSKKFQLWFDELLNEIELNRVRVSQKGILALSSRKTKWINSFVLLTLKVSIKNIIKQVRDLLNHFIKFSKTIIFSEKNERKFLKHWGRWSILSFRWTNFSLWKLKNTRGSCILKLSCLQLSSSDSYIFYYRDEPNPEYAP